MVIAHRLDSDLTLVLYSDFTDLCWRVKESKVKMLRWIHIQPVIIHLKALCKWCLNKTNNFSDCKTVKWRRKQIEIKNLLPRHLVKRHLLAPQENRALFGVFFMLYSIGLRQYERRFGSRKPVRKKEA